MVQPRTPAEDAINDRIIARGLHRRSDEVVSKMLEAVTVKATRYDADIDRHTNFPGAVLWELKEQEDSLIGREAQDELASRLQFYVDKKARLLDKKFLMEQERAFRRDGKVSRTEIID